MSAVDPGAFDALVRARRTNLRVDPDREVPKAVVERLCRLAVWAPNHKRTEPWRFCAVSGDGRRALGAAMRAGLVAAGVTDEGKLAKAAGKYQRAPVVLLVGCAHDPDPHRHLEDRDAVAAAVQTLLLGAEASGLASYWSSAPDATLGPVKQLVGWAPDDAVVGLVYLGWPTGEVPVPERTDPSVHWITTAG